MGYEDKAHDIDRNSQIVAEISSATSSHQFTILGDTSHSSESIRDFLKSPELVDAAQKGGVKHIFLEYPAGLQDEVDQLRRGEITKEEFAENISTQFNGWFTNKTEEIKHFSDMADFILDAQKSGIAVHFADVTDAERNFDIQEQLEHEFGKDSFEKFQDITENLLNAAGAPRSNDPLSGLKQASELSPEQMEKIKDTFNSLPKSDQEDFLRISSRAQEIFLENIDKTRLNDTQVTQHITAIAGSDKSLIIYGAYHDHMRDLLSQAGLSNYTIDIIDPNSKGNPYGFSGKKEPDAKADLVTGEVQNQNTPPPAPTVTTMNPKSAFANPSMSISQ